MRLVYIAGPYTGETTYDVLENIRKAEKVAIRYWKMGYAVICPHKNTAFLEGSIDPDSLFLEPWLEGCFEMIRRCDVIVMMKDWDKSPGARQEHTLAKEFHLEIIYEKEE